ncbi:MAG: hypothetical protein ACTSUE_23390 [Promethearchaeota archaeon]
MAELTGYDRLTGIFEEIINVAVKIEDLASKTDILGNIARVYSDLGDVTKNYRLIEKSLEVTGKIEYDYRRIVEETHVASHLRRAGMKVKALNLLWKIRDESRKIKDLELKTKANLEIADQFFLLNELDDYHGVMQRILSTLESFTGSTLLKVNSYLSVYKFFIVRDLDSEAEKIFLYVKSELSENGTEKSSNLGELLQSIVNTFISISNKKTENPVKFLLEAIDLLKEYPSFYEIDVIYRDILKQLFKIKGSDWIEDNLDFLINIIDQVDNGRVKLEIVYQFLIKAYREKLDIDPEYIEQLIQSLEMDKMELSPSRFISFQLMKLQLIGIFVNQKKYFQEVETLLNDVLKSSRFRRNLPEKVTMILLNIVDFHGILNPDSLDILNLATGLTLNYAILEKKSEILRRIVIAMVKHALNSSDPELLEKCVDEAKNIEILDERFFTLLEIAEALYEMRNVTLAKNIIEGLMDEVKNVKKPKFRVKAKLMLAKIVMNRENDLENTIRLLHESIQDANLFIIGNVNKAMAYDEIVMVVSEIYQDIFESEESKRRNKYGALIADAKEHLGTGTLESVEKAIECYVKALQLLDDNMDKYEQVYVSDQIESLKEYLKKHEEGDDISFKEDEWFAPKDYRVKKSDISLKQTISWRKKRELLYQIQITNNSRFPLNNLNCRIKKHARDFLELMHDGVQKTGILKSKGTFTCEFNFIAKRDIVPNKAIEAEVNFFDPINNTPTSIDLEHPNTNSGFKFFFPKTISTNKFDKIKSRIEKKTYEFQVPYNVHLSWQKLNGLVKNPGFPFKVIEKDSNEIANQFFGVVRLYAESRWARTKKHATAFQIILSGDINEHETNLKIEFFLQDPIIFYNLVNLLQEQIEVWNCPNVNCNAPLDKEQIRPQEPGVCKYCSSIFYLDANPKKNDKPVKLNHIKFETLAADDKIMELLVKKLKKLKGDDIDAILEFIPAEQREEMKQDLEKISNGDVKVRDFILSSIAEKNKEFIHALIQTL